MDEKGQVNRRDDSGTPKEEYKDMQGGEITVLQRNKGGKKRYADKVGRGREGCSTEEREARST